MNLAKSEKPALTKLLIENGSDIHKQDKSKYQFFLFVWLYKRVYTINRYARI